MCYSSSRIHMIVYIAVQYIEYIEMIYIVLL